MNNQRLTLANKITIVRILLIPVFVFLVVDYVRGFRHGQTAEWERWLACAVFAVASVSDAVDGYIARRFRQKSVLGSFLDPLADKALLITALVLLARDNGEAFMQLPLWFLVLVISRDILLVAGAILIHMLAGSVQSRPRVVGKCATFFQMITLGWVLLKIEQPTFHWPMCAAGAFTLVSGIWYMLDGAKQLTAHGAKKP